MTKYNHRKGENNNDESSEDLSLETLYQHRKRRYLSPEPVKKIIIDKIATSYQAKQPWWKINIKPYMQISAVACSVAVAFIVIGIQLVNQAPIDPMNESASLASKPSSMMSDLTKSINYQVVELHVLAGPSQERLAASEFRQQSSKQERKVQYQSAQQSLASKQADLAVYEQTYATIIKSEEGLSLVTCDKHLLKLSQEVVDLLLTNKKNDSIDFSDGQILAIAFDENGHIIDMRNQSNKKEC